MRDRANDRVDPIRELLRRSPRAKPREPDDRRMISIGYRPVSAQWGLHRDPKRAVRSKAQTFDGSVGTPSVLQIARQGDKSADAAIASACLNAGTEAIGGVALA